MTRLIHFAGGAGDRNDRAMAGAAALSRLLSQALGREIERVGNPARVIPGLWRAQLDAAMPDLLALRDAAAAMVADQPALIVLNRCTAALATLPAVLRARPDACVVWFDAHADCNSPDTSMTGYVGGMVLTGAAGRWDTGLGTGLPLSSVILVGTRDFDPCERALVDDHTVTLVPPGPAPALVQALAAAIAGRPVYIHLDCDVLDAGLLATEFQVAGGLSLADLQATFAMLATHQVIGLEIAEYEATWPDGTASDPAPLVTAIMPVLQRCAGAA